MSGENFNEADSFFFRPHSEQVNTPMEVPVLSENEKEEGDHCNDEEVRLTQERGEQSRKLLFVHQTAWQKRLLRLYGNEICLLDAKYKTTRYACFFLVEKANVDYHVIGSFVTEDETVCSIKEALEVVREWNPDWLPHLFMTDNCSKEIQAIENLFPGKSGLMITQPEFKFKDARVRLWK